MMKTYIRIKDHYLIKDNGDYFISSCSEYDTWKKLKKKDLHKYKRGNVTSHVKDQQKKHGRETNVNYIIDLDLEELLDVIEKPSKKSKKSKKKSAKGQTKKKPSKKIKISGG